MQKKLKTRLGRVASNAMDKTVVVVVERGVRHPLYKKVMRRRTRYKVHDEANTCQVGDVVRLVETRPMSKEKRWRVVEIVTQEKAVAVEPKEIKEEDPVAVEPRDIKEEDPGVVEPRDIKEEDPVAVEPKDIKEEDPVAVEPKETKEEGPVAEE